MSDINHVIITGRAASRPQLKETTSQKEYCFLTLGVNEYDYKTKKAIVNFVKFSVWGKLAAIVCDKIDKGAAVTVHAKVRIKKGDLTANPKVYDQITLVAEDAVFTAAPQQDREEEQDPNEPI